MTAANEIQEALKMRCDIYVPCRYCRATEAETAHEIMLRLASCTN